MTEPRQLGRAGAKWLTVLNKVPGPLKGKQLKLRIIIIIKCQSLIDCFSVRHAFRREIVKD